MSGSSFPSMISNEPPPLDSTSDEEDSEDFRTPGLKLDIPSAEPSPLSTPQKKPQQPQASVYEEVQLNIKQDEDSITNCAQNLDKVEDEYVDFQNFQEADSFSDAKLQIFSENSNGLNSPVISPANLPDLLESKENFINPIIPIADFSEPTEETGCSSGESFSTADSAEISPLSTPQNKPPQISLPDVEETQFIVENDSILNHYQEDEEEDDFADFQNFQEPTCSLSQTKPIDLTANSNNLDNSMPSPKRSINDTISSMVISETNTSASKENCQNPEENFLRAKQPPSSTQQPQVFEKVEFIVKNDCTYNFQNEEDDDDFADFQVFTTPDFSESSKSFNSSVLGPRSSLDFSATLESKFDNLIKTVIPLENTSALAPPETGENFGEGSKHIQYKSIDKEINENTDSHWSHVQDFEESKGLLYKWLNSLCQQRMYKSLKIDTSNIVYTEKWGAIEVPRFAASMVETPKILQPLVYQNSNQVYNSVHKSCVPQSEDAPSSASKKPLSKEAQQILQQIPDISFMRAKTLVFPQASRSSSNSLL